MTNYFCKYLDSTEMRKEIRWKVQDFGFFIFAFFMIVGLFASLIYGGIYGIRIENYMLATYSFLMSIALFMPSIQMVVFLIRFVMQKGTNAEVEVLFHDDCFVVNEERSFSYAHISKIKQTQNYIIIHIHEPNKPFEYLPICKSTLNCATNEFIGYLKNKKRESKQCQTAPAR